MAAEVADQLPPLDSLKCQRCKNYLKDPITLQCLHSFCLDCLLKYNGATRNEVGQFIMSVNPEEIGLHTRNRMTSGDEDHDEDSKKKNVKSSSNQDTTASEEVVGDAIKSHIVGASSKKHADTDEKDGGSITGEGAGESGKETNEAQQESPKGEKLPTQLSAEEDTELDENQTSSADPDSSNQANLNSKQKTLKGKSSKSKKSKKRGGNRERDDDASEDSEVEDEDEDEDGDEGGSGDEEEEEEPEVRVLQCPTCTEVLGLPEPEIPSEPFENARLARLVSLVHDTPVLCQNCKESQSEYKCSTCEAYCCKPCWNSTHEAPIFKSHVAVPLRHDEMSAMPKCPQHSQNDLEFFVTEEEVGACQVCLLKGDFVGRPYSLVTDVRDERQQQIEEGLEGVLEARSFVDSGKEESEEVMQELGSNLEQTKSAVQKNFADIREALAAREKQTLESLQRLHDAKRRVLEAQVDRMNRTMRQIDDGVNNVRLVLDYSNPLEVVYSTYVLQDHIETVGNVKATAPKSCRECTEENVPCHHPAVDSALPVVLSDRASQIVRSYAAVPDADVIERVALGEGTDDELAPAPTQEQQQLLADVAGAAGNQEDWGCVVQ